ncbi:MAG: MBL fold metallo-hydrolase [Planctomycetota bacterium]
MKVELLPSTFGGPSVMQFCMSLLINDKVALDAGTLGFLWPVDRQRQVQHVFLSHSHADHIASLPMFLDNVYEPIESCPQIYAGPETLDCLRKYIFNDTYWPDFIRLSAEENPFLTLCELTSETPVGLPCGITVTPVLLHHTIPTFGFIVEDSTVTVAFVSDTGPTEQIWKLLRLRPRLAAVFLECSFPNKLEWLAGKSGHLCPRLFAAELQKFDSSVPLLVYHLKPAFQEQIARELEALQRPGLQLAVSGHAYEFRA